MQHKERIYATNSILKARRHWYSTPSLYGLTIFAIPSHPPPQVRHIVIDEVDTMLTQGFTSEIMELVTPIVKAAKDYRPPSGCASTHHDDCGGTVQKRHHNNEPKPLVLCFFVVAAIIGTMGFPGPAVPKGWPENSTLKFICGAARGVLFEVR